jgi:predicted dehydrogenase
VVRTSESPRPVATELRAVAIGAGAHIFGAAHAPALERLGVQVLGIHDADPERARAAAASRGWRAVSELDALLALDADFAVITTPHGSHAELALACLRANLHVFVEKPVALRIEDADAVAAGSMSSGLTVAVALQHRLRAEVREAKRLIDDGFLGALHRLELTAYYPKRSAYYAASAWRGASAGEGGGVLGNQGQHDLDLIVHLAGAPTRVTGLLRTRVQRIESEDTVEALVEWANGATGTIHISSAAVDGPPRLTLIGTAGVLRILPGRLSVTANELDMREFAATDGDPFDRPGVREAVDVTGGGGTHEDLYRDFVRALREGTAPIAPVASAVGAVELSNAIVRSARTGAAVTLPLERGTVQDGAAAAPGRRPGA